MKNVVLCLTMITALSACSTLQNAVPDQLFVPNYSQPAADLKNELILLNIARSANYQPMHFIRITGITNSSTVSATAGLGASLPQRGRSFTDTFDNQGNLSGVQTVVGSSAATYTPTLGGAFAFNPVINYEILDSKEFYNGILAPLSDENFSYFYSQGWNENMLEMLLIEKVTLNIPGYEIKKLDNDPNNETNIGEFRMFSSCLKTSPGKKESSESKFTYEAKPKGFSIKELNQVSDILDKTGWSVNEKDRQFVRKTGGGAGVSVNFEECKKHLSKISSKTNDSKNQKKAVLANEEKKEQEPSVEIVFRSTQGVIYYMGECLREVTDKQSGTKPYPCFYDKTNVGTGTNGEISRKYISYIQEHSNGFFPNSSILQTELNGKKYFIPNAIKEDCTENPKLEKTKSKCTAENRTFSSISFIDQLLSLQQEESNSPTPTTVIGLNQ